MEETIRICRDQKFLNEFLKKCEVELMDMLEYLYYNEFIMRNHDAQLAREAKKEGISIGRAATEQEFTSERVALLAKISRLKNASAMQ